MRKRLTVGTVVVLVLCCALLGGAMLGCTHSQMANFKSLGRDAHVKLYSGGQLIGEWDSEGKVTTEDHSDGYIFVDKKTGHFLRITGQIIIEN